jgi:hypothetical protein
MTDSTKSGPVLSMKGQRQHGPSTWWLVRCLSKSEGFINDSSTMGLANSQMEFESTKVVINAHQRQKTNWLGNRRNCRTEVWELFTFAANISKVPVSVDNGIVRLSRRNDVGGLSTSLSSYALYVFSVHRLRVPPFTLHNLAPQTVVSSNLAIHQSYLIIVSIRPYNFRVFLSSNTTDLKACRI